MAREIERKFLVNEKKLSTEKLDAGEKIAQGYLSTDPEKTVRVRLKGGSGFLTVKGKTVGITRTEFEYKIPVDDARELLKLCEPNVLKKIRRKIEYAGHIWEIDFFEGRHEGLILAEVEIKSENEVVRLPEWIEREVSDDPQYFNSALSKIS